MKSRPSKLLDICCAFAIIGTIPVLLSWVWLDFCSPGWTLAWCNNASPAIYWVLLYAWALSGVAIAYFLFRRRRLIAYGITITSYACFWTTIACVNHDIPDWNRDCVLILLFGGLMIRSYVAYRSRMIDLPDSGSHGDELGIELGSAQTFQPRTDDQNPYAPPSQPPAIGGR